MPPAPFPPAGVPAPAPREGPRYSRLAALVLSFFSSNLYRDVAQRWRGFGFWYLVLLVSVSWLPFAIKAQVGFSKFVRQEAPRTLQGFPGITINQGVVSIDRPEPYLWRDPDSKEVIMYVDTSGAFDLPEGARAKVKLGRSQVTVEQSAYETRTYDLSQVQSFSVDKTRLLGWMQTASYWIGVGLFGFMAVLTLVWHLIQILIYAAIGLALCGMLGARLDYPALLRLAVIAITPAVLIDTALDFAGVHLPFSGWVWLALEMAYLALAIKANAAPTAPPPGFPIYAGPQTYAPPPVYPPPVPSGQ